MSEKISTQLHKHWIYHIEIASAEVAHAAEWVANQARRQSQDAEIQTEMKLDLQPQQAEASVLEQ